MMESLAYMIEACGLDHMGIYIEYFFIVNVISGVRTT